MRMIRGGRTSARLAALLTAALWLGCVAPPPTEVAEYGVMPGRTHASLRLRGRLPQDDDAPRVVARIEAIGYGDPCEWVNTKALKYWYTGLGLIAFLIVPGGGTPVSMLVEPERVGDEYLLDL